MKVYKHFINLYKRLFIHYLDVYN